MDAQSIIDEVKRILGEPSGADEGYWDDEDYRDEINRGCEEYAKETKCLKSYAEFDADGTTLLWDITEDSLDDFLDITEIWYFTSDDCYDVLKSVDRDTLAKMQSGISDTTGTPTYFCYEDRTIEFDVIPNDGDTIRVYYYRVPSPDEEVSANTDTPIIPEKYHQAIVYWVAWHFSLGDELRQDKVVYLEKLWLMSVAKSQTILRPAASTYTTIKDVRG